MQVRLASIQQTFRGALVRRLLYLYVILGLTPILAFVIIPMVYRLHPRASLTISSLLIQLVVSGVVFFIVILIGGLVTLSRLALPIQELAKGAEAITQGDLSYRVPIAQRGDDELIALTHRFNTMARAVQDMRDDIESQRATLENALAVREAEFGVINKIAELANRQNDLRQTLYEALRVMRDGLGADMLTLSLVSETGDLFCAARSCDEAYAPLLARHCKQHLSQDMLRRAVETRQPVKAVDIDWDALSDALRHSFQQMNIARVAATPIINKGRVLGVLMIMRGPDNPIPEQKVVLLHALVEHVGLLIENIQSQEQRRLLSILEERRRLASELHDSVTQSLFTLTLTAEGLKVSLADSDMSASNKRALDMLAEQTRNVQTEMRTLINELRPVDLNQETLTTALRRHAESLRYAAQVDVEVVTEGDVARIPYAIQRNLNRVAQEALSNIARHAEAQHAHAHLNIQDTTIRLEITDDGIGFDPQTGGHSSFTSLGLVSMRERAEMMGGTLRVCSERGAGTTITLDVPLEAGENDD